MRYCELETKKKIEPQRHRGHRVKIISCFIAPKAHNNKYLRALCVSVVKSLYSIMTEAIMLNVGVESGFTKVNRRCARKDKCG